MILEPRHTPLQDTNDRFLANLQKDGTYSVVPRVPGGEITPEKLIVLGEVAKSTASTPRSPGRSGSTSSARASSSSRPSGASWWMPASSRATPTARRCAR